MTPGSFETQRVSPSEKWAGSPVGPRGTLSPRSGFNIEEPEFAICSVRTKVPQGGNEWLRDIAEI